jgi:trimeric autotransporter adhesin
MSAGYQTRYRQHDIRVPVYADSQGNLSASPGTDVIEAGSGMDSFQSINSGGATGTESIALGLGAVASDSDTVAIGSGAQATAVNSIAFGQNIVNTLPATLLFGVNGVIYQRLEAPQVVQQTGSNSTAVTLNASQGIVNMFGNLGSTTTVTFNINNDRVTASSVIHVGADGASTNNRALFITFRAAPGVLTIVLRNGDTVPAQGAPAIHFMIYGGA